METPMATCARMALGIAAIPSRRRAEKIRRAIRIRFTFPLCIAGGFFGQLLSEEEGRLRARVGANS